MKKLYLFYLMIILTNESFGQGYVPPSPDAAALLEYANVPVSLYTGTPQINIPLYQLKGRDLKIPVSISYHASGIKVQDIASSVGLGWALQAGGVVTRIVRGLPDEDENGFCGVNKIGRKVEENLTREYLEKIIEGKWDSEPDIFYFSISGMEGRFILDKDGNPLPLPEEDFIIKPAIGPQKINYWSIIDKNGTVYNFGKTPQSQEQTTYKISHQEEDKAKTFTSSWFISEIISNTKDKISFKYEQGEELNYKYFRQVRSNIYSYTGNFCEEEWPEENSWDENIEIKVVNPKYLNKIISSKGEMVFSYLGGRIDLDGGRYLHSISVKHVNKTIKTFNFFYDYFTNSNCNETSFLCKRLKLERIEERSGGASILKNKFLYNISENLPARNSYKYDHWGFYNNNQYNSAIPPFEEYPGATKEPDSDKSQANILKEIINSTGGSVKLFFELHQYNDEGVLKYAGGVRVNKIIENDGISSTNMVKNYTYHLENSSLSSGELYRLPLYSYFYLLKILVPGDVWTACYWSFLRRHSESVVDLFDINGTHIGYKNVQVKSIGRGEELYTYTNFLDHPDILPEQFFYRASNSSMENIDVNGPPFTPYSTLNWERGLLKEKKVVNESGKLLKLQQYEYEFYKVSNRQVYGLRALLNEYNNYDLFNVYVGKYKTFHKGVRIKKMYEVTYDQVKNIKVDSITTYRYDPLYKSIVKRVAASAEFGDSIITTYRYPQDYPYKSSTTPVNKMKDLHMINNIIEQKVSIKKGTTEKVLSADLTEYKADGSLIVPGKTFSFRSNDGVTGFTDSNLSSTGVFQYDSRYKKETTFTDYDTDGNLLDVSSHDGVRTSYIWEDNNTYPIAKVTNASPDEIAYTSFEGESAKGGWTYRYQTNDVSSCSEQYSIDYEACQQIPGYSPDYATCMSKTVADFEACKAYIENSYTITNHSRKTGNISFRRGSVSKTRLPIGNYVVSFWVKKIDENSAGSISGSVSVSNVESIWKLYKFTLNNITSVNISVSPNVLLDELRLYPVDAKMTTFTYDPLVGVTSISDENNRPVNYKYDDLSRLDYVFDHKGNIIKQYDYHYKE